MKTYTSKLSRTIGLLSVTSLLAVGGWLSAADVTQPSDTIVGSSGNVSGDGAVANAIDNNTATKYLNFDKVNTGFTVTPAAGPSRVTGLSLTSANDAPERDPASFNLFGSSDGGAHFALIASGNVPAFSGRFVQQDFTFPNTAIYTSYKLVFPTVANAGVANSMQIAEVQLNGDVPVAADTFPPVISTIASPDATHVVIHLSEAVDPSVATASFNDGLNIVAAPALSADGTTITLTTSPQTPAHTYTLTTSGTKDLSGNVMAPNTTATFVAFAPPPPVGFGVGIDFLGRNGNGTPPPGVALAPADVAGVVPRANWNEVDDGNKGDHDTAGVLFDGTGSLVDSSGAPTPVTLNYSADDNWNNDDGAPTANADRKMMYGVIKNNGGNNATALFYFNNVPQAAYDLYVYTTVNGDGVKIDLSDGLTSYYTTEQHVFSGTYVQASNQNPSGTRDTGNYVKFSNVYLSGGGQIFLSAHWAGGGDGLGISGFQLIQVTDTYAPKIARAQGGINTVNVIFTEPVSDDAATTSHYSIPGLSISAGSLDATKRVVTLTTSQQTKGTTYTVTVNGVVDRSPAANAILANSSKTFTPQYGLNLAVAFRGGAAGPGITPTPMRSFDAAGVVPTPNYNNINGQVNLDAPLSDVDGSSTPVTITFRADEQWGSGTGEPNHTTGAGNHGDVNEANHRLLNEYLGPSNDPHHGRDIVLKNVPYSTYNLIVYTSRDACCEPSAVSSVGNTAGPMLHIIQDGADPFIDNFVTDGQPRWLRGQSTDPAHRDTCNYVQFDNVQPDALGQIRIPIQSESFRACTPGLQLIEVNSNPLQFVTQPVNTSTKEVQTFTFTASVLGALPHNAQWYTNGVAVAGATLLSFSGTASQDLEGMQVYVTVNNGISTITSSIATLHVLVDNVPPTLVEATADPIANHVRLLFSEPVAVAPGNFTFTVGGLNVTGTEIQPDLKTVLLTTDNPLVAGTSYTLQILGVHDLAGIPNLIAPNPTIATFTGWACTNGVLLRQMYLGESGANNFAATIFSDPNFPCNPTLIDYLTSFNSPQTSFDHYGLRVTGYLLPNETGDYLFRVHSDDSGRFSISTDSSKSNLVIQIDAQGDCGGCGSPVSTIPVHLVAGHAYYVEGLMEEGTGGDYLEVSWRNSGAIPSFVIIPGANLSYCVNPDTLHVTVTGPADVNVTECRSATFSVAVSASCGAGSATYQWQLNGADVPNATDSSFTTGLLHQGDNGTVHCVVTALGSTTVSRDAALTVLPDTTPPAIANIRGDTTLHYVYVTFTEAVDPSSAADGVSYAIFIGNISDGNFLNITDPAGQMIDDRTVRFSTDPQIPGQRYNVIVNPGTLDLCQANGIADPFGAFTAWQLKCGYAIWEVYGPISGTTIPDLLGSPLFPDHPRETFVLSSFDSRQAYPDDTHDNYGSRFTATFTAPVDGDYTFYMENDDDAELDLDGVSILAKPCCNGTFVDTAASGVITMTAGSTHALVALQKEGGGGDYIRIAVRIPGDSTPTANLATINPSYLSSYVNLDTFTTLPTSGMLASGSMTVRGFDGRLVKITPGVSPVPNSTATAEALLAGTFTDAGGGPYPNQASVPCFVEPGIINYNIEATSYGHILGDVPFPGFPQEVTTNTEDMALELVTYVELTAGLHTWGVNSDDGFRVSCATSVTDPNNATTLGEFSGGRGTSDTTFTFDVPQNGLYPIRLVWEQGNGGANIEFWEFDCATGTWHAINGPGGPRAFRPLPAGPLPALVCSDVTANLDPLSCDHTVTYAKPTFAVCVPAVVTCAPPSGSSFPLGPTPVHCVADDGFGNTSACTFNVTLVDGTAPTISCPSDMNVNAPGQTTATVTYIVSASDCTLVSLNCAPPSGSAFPSGATTVNCTATDGAAHSSACSFVVTVNNPPDVKPAISCSYSDHTNAYVIALDGSNACIILDASASVDVNHDPLVFHWSVDGAATNSPGGPIVTNCLDVGCHTITLTVSDGHVTVTVNSNLCVISASGAIDQCIALVDGSNVARKNLRPLIATLKAAGASFDRGDFIPALNQLNAFQNKVAAQIARDNPTEAAAFIMCAQQIMDAVNCAAVLGTSGVGGP